MKRTLILLTFLAAFGFSGACEARNYFGVRFGYPELGLQIGNSNLFAKNLGGRVTADFNYYGSSVVLGADLLYTLPVPTPNTSFDLAFYLGGGLGLGLGLNGGQNFGYNLHGVLGLDFIVNKDFSLFLEVRPFGWGDYGYYYGGSLGLNLTL